MEKNRNWGGSKKGIDLDKANGLANKEKNLFLEERI